MSDFEDFVAAQFPFRPDHPDFERLQRVVQIVEKLKADGVDPKVAYETICDVYSLSYLAVNRAGMNVPNKPTITRIEAVDLMANGWVEGFLYGVLFARQEGER